MTAESKAKRKARRAALGLVDAQDKPAEVQAAARAAKKTTKRKK